MKAIWAPSASPRRRVGGVGGTLRFLFILLPMSSVARRFHWSLYVLAALFVGAGLLHFWHPATYLRIMPPALPAPRLLVLLSGAAEVAGGDLLGAGLEEPRGSGGRGGGVVHAGAPAPPLLLPPDGGSATARQRGAGGAGVCVRRSSGHVGGVAWLWLGQWAGLGGWGCADGGPPPSVSQRAPFLLT